MLNDRVRAGEHQASVTVVETHQVGRFPARSPDLDDLARPLRLAHEVATHVEPVPDGCLHPPTSLPAFRATRAHDETLTMCHIATASIYPGADGWYRLRPGSGYCKQAGDNDWVTVPGLGGKSRRHAPRWHAAARPTVSAAVAASWVLGGWLLGAGVRRVSVRTGVSDEEAFGSLPGDEFIAHPMVEWTRGVTVHAAPERVWPWLAQMGYGRGGWYTPEWVDLFANRWVFGIRHPFPASAGRLLPEYQHVAVGDLICDGPDYASYFRVLRVDPQHALVYRSIRHPRRGSPIDITDPASPQRVEQQLREAGTYMDFTSALLLIERPGQGTRLLLRTRANYSPRAIRLLALPFVMFDATYGVAMLRAIARRADTPEPTRT
jgi:hypothetical protein